MEDPVGTNRSVVAWVALAVALVALLLGGVGLWVASSDLRAMARLADAVFSPEETIRPDPVALVKGVRDLARLETAEVEIEQRIVGQRGSESTWGWIGERMELVARGRVVAGVDLSELPEEAIAVDDDGIVRIRLPQAEVFTVALDEEQTRVVDRERGWLGWPDAQFESRVRREAVVMVREAALQQGVLADADAQAQQVVGALLEQAGVETVVFE
jgi:hypothetical protein